MPRCRLKKKIEYMSMGVIALAFLFAVILSFYIYFSVSRPLKKLRLAFEQVGKGDLNIKQETVSKDEIGDLALVFRQMVSDLKKLNERKKYYSANLEKKVKEKTKNIRKNEEALYNMMQDVNETNKTLEEEKKSVENKVRERTLELQKAYEDLKKLDIAKEEFISIISHELKTPLFPIMGYINMVLDGKMGSITPQQKEKFAVVAKCANNLNRLIEDMLDMSKLELKKIKLDIQKENMENIAKEATEGMEFMTKNKKMSLTLDAPNKVEADCDRKRILQVIDNFITNAIKFTKANGHIVIKVRKEGDNAVVTVTDDGIGISPDNQKYLFNRFYQVKQGIQREYGGGTGLGLAISKGIIDLHKGKAIVISKPNKGSTFGFSIPIKSMIKEKKTAKKSAESIK